MAVITKSADIADVAPARVDQVVKTLTGLSHTRLRGLFDHGCVSINGQLCGDASARVAAPDRVEVRYDPHQGYREKRKWSDRAFSIVYEDAHLIVVNKAAHILTVATSKSERNTLESRVTHYLQHSSRRRQAFVAHRLDRGVSGLLVFAKSPAVLGKLRDQFRARKPERLYLAIVAGILRPPSGTFRSHLQTADNLDQFSTEEEGEGLLAITHYRVRRTLRDTSVVEVRLETGRRNQIRVHLAEAGHPVLGDPRYGGKVARHPLWREQRLALHALSLGFDHPVTGQPMLFASDLPGCMRQFVDRGL
jgi:23S rRNA pseudouridine1911/1915/1917 synthase